MTKHINSEDHIFRYVGGASIDGDFIEPAAFRRKEKDGQMEVGLSVNWVEWFGKQDPLDAVRPLSQIFMQKNFKIGKTSRFALLNVGEAKAAAAKYAQITIVLDCQPNDASHSLVTNYPESLNDQIAEQLAKIVTATYPAA